jgi:hypothetical protein
MRALPDPPEPDLPDLPDFFRFRDTGTRASIGVRLNSRTSRSLGGQGPPGRAGESGGVSYSLYADHPAVRAELATLAAAEAAAHLDLEVGALVGDGHLILAVQPRDRSSPPILAEITGPRPRRR